jgi:hypothetical protein
MIFFFIYVKEEEQVAHKRPHPSSLLSNQQKKISQPNGNIGQKNEGRKKMKSTSREDSNKKKPTHSGGHNSIQTKKQRKILSYEKKERREA